MTKNISEKKTERERRPAVKARRRDNKTKRNQVRYNAEKKDVDTYQSDIALFDNYDQNFPIIEELSTCETFSTEDISIVFFDLETGGFSPTKDILQVAMKSEKWSLCTYVTPTNQTSCNKYASFDEEWK